MAKITKDIGIVEAVQTYPEVLEVLQENGLGCVGCMAAQFETLEQGATAHGLDADKLIEEINKRIAD